jgi:DNA helicase-2/ATP-dependent DNA helicase PcrA
VAVAHQPPPSDTAVANLHLAVAWEAARKALVQAETAHAAVLGGQVVVGRIDAVYRGPGGSYEVVDWKTGHRDSADPVRLALYRLAWAELKDVPLGQVRVLLPRAHRLGRRAARPAGARAELEALIPGRADAG